MEKDSFPKEVEIRGGIVWKKIPKKKILKKRCNDFNWDKSPD